MESGHRRRAGRATAGSRTEAGCGVSARSTYRCLVPECRTILGRVKSHGELLVLRPGVVAKQTRTDVRVICPKCGAVRYWLIEDVA